MSTVSSTSFHDVMDMECLWEKMSYIWIIEDVDASFEGKSDKKLLSPTFYSKGGNYAWQVEFSLLESVPESSRYLNLYLNSITMPYTAVEAKYELSIRNSGDCVIKTGQDERRFTTQSKSWGFENFIQWFELPSSIPKKTLKIRAEVLMKIKHIEAENHVITMDPDSAVIRLQKSMNDMFVSSKHTDVVLEVGQAELKVHQCILSARSPVFAAMFAHESIEKSSGVVKILDFNSDDFTRFLHFVYSGKVDIPSVNVAIALFRAGDKYDFPELKLACKNFISAHLDSSNIGPVLLFAETYGVKDLKETAMQYMIQNIKKFCDAKMDVYTLLETENPQLLIELLVMLAEK